MTFKCCKPVYFKHEDGWDVYPKSECYRPHWDRPEWVPAWFDAPLVEDAPTRAAARQEIADAHPLGFCLFTF